MNAEITNSLTSILINVSELQTNLLMVPEAGDSMNRLCNIRKIALGVLESETAMDGLESGPMEGYRVDAVGQMVQLHEMISTYKQGRYRQEQHAHVLFGIGLAAGNLAKMIQHVFELCDCDELKETEEA